jgi:hypothetical protein
MYDLQQFDVCKEEAATQDSVINVQSLQLLAQQSIIELYIVKDSLRESQFKDCMKISTLKDEKVDILQHEVGKFKKITIGTVIVAVLGIIFL